MLRAIVFIIKKHFLCVLEILKALPSAPNILPVQLQISGPLLAGEGESIFKFLLNISPV